MRQGSGVKCLCVCVWGGAVLEDPPMRSVSTQWGVGGCFLGLSDAEQP